MITGGSTGYDYAFPNIVRQHRASIKTEREKNNYVCSVTGQRPTADDDASGRHSGAHRLLHNKVQPK